MKRRPQKRAPSRSGRTHAAANVGRGTGRGDGRGAGRDPAGAGRDTGGKARRSTRRTSSRSASARSAAPREGGSVLGLELRQLRAFVTLVDQGNMTAAAQRLGVAQSTVSEALTAMERALGTHAMARRRGVHGVELTPAGLALLPYARSVLASVDDAYVAVAAVARDIRGSVEVVANESVSTYLLPPALGVLRDKWPNIRFAVTVGMCPDIYEGLATGRFDIGLMLQTPICANTDPALPKPPPGAAERALYLSDVPLVLFSSAKHPLALAGHAANDGLSRDQLTPYPVFVSDAKGYFHAFIRDFFYSDGTPGPRLEPTGSVEAVKRSIVSNPRGLGVLPEYAVAEELRAGRMHALRLRPSLPAVRLEAMLYRTRTPMHPAVAELIDVLSSTLAGRAAGLARWERAASRSDDARG